MEVCSSVIQSICVPSGINASLSLLKYTTLVCSKTDGASFCIPRQRPERLLQSAESSRGSAQVSVGAAADQGWCERQFALLTEKKLSLVLWYNLHCG